MTGNNKKQSKLTEEERLPAVGERPWRAHFPGLALLSAGFTPNYTWVTPSEGQRLHFDK